MPKYMVRASYSQRGLEGLLREGGSARRAAVTKAVEGLGGKVESMYFALGEEDAFLIVDLPSTVSVAALALRVGAAGVGKTTTTVLLSPEEVDEATNTSVEYTPPGA